MNAGLDHAIDAFEDLTAAVDYAIVGPRDNRIHEIRTTVFPFRTICYLARDFGDGALRGCTGVLIGPRLVLTAGHCLFSHRRGHAPRRIAVIPARADRDALPFGKVITSRYFAPRAYLERANIGFLHHDYGVITLPRGFPGINRFMTLQAPSDQDFDKIKQASLITIAGYPSDRPIGTLWRHSERIKRVTRHRIYYTVDTCPGHSGSPVWYRSTSGRSIIIGIHTSGIVDELGRSYGCRRDTILAPPGMMNSGIRITPAIMAAVLDPLAHTANGAMVALP